MSDITKLPGVGLRRAEILGKLEIKTINDLLRHYPRRYEDRRLPVSVSALADGEAALVRVSVLRLIESPDFVRRGGSKKIPMKVICSDGSGELTLLFFNARWLARAFHVSAEYFVYGTARRDFAGVSMAHPDFERIQDEGDEAAEGAGIIPIYPLTAGVTQKYLRGLMRSALSYAEREVSFFEVIPAPLCASRRLAPLSYALSNIHFPAGEEEFKEARYRLIYEEFFLLQLRLLYARSKTGLEEEGERTCSEEISETAAYSLFPFELTGAQLRAISEIYSDMSTTSPMHRLLQGDVGSGKTAVAAAAALYAARSGFQTAVMAPTEILATQHLKEFLEFFKGSDISLALLTSGLTPAQRREALVGLESGSINIAIGTHALIEPDVKFLNLGLVVTDEQHRFGVRQRLRLREKGRAPDTLVMTATPIPRTLALMLYADLDVSVLDEMPPGRKIVSTRFINSSRRDEAYEFAEGEMAAGRQVYVVAPRIGDEDEEDGGDAGDGGDGGGDMATVLGLTEELAGRFPDRRIAAMHGRFKAGEKDEIMRGFMAGEIDMLVSTVVIEVGVNVPNATVMIIENSERFGLAQLHQLRGRVGRGAEKSYCVLISDSKSELAIKRGETLERENDGFKIAELDLVLRGPGDLFGVRQHGIPSLKIADPARHMEVLKQTNEDVRELLERDPGLELLENAVLNNLIHEVFESRRRDEGGDFPYEEKSFNRNERAGFSA